MAYHEQRLMGWSEATTVVSPGRMIAWSVCVSVQECAVWVCGVWGGHGEAGPQTWQLWQENSGVGPVTGKACQDSVEAEVVVSVVWCTGLYIW